MKFGSQTVTGTLLWGSYPTKEEFLSRMDEMIPGTYLPVFGTVQLCNLDGNCFGNLSDDFIGQGPSTLGMIPGGFWIHLNQATPELVSEYVLKIESQSDPEAVFECKIVFARSQEAAEEFIAQAGVSAIVDDAARPKNPGGLPCSGKNPDGGRRPLADYSGSRFPIYLRQIQRAFRRNGPQEPDRPGRTHAV